MQINPGLHPPRPRLTLNVGVTGHRAHVIKEGLVAELRVRFGSTFFNLAVATVTAFETSGPYFSDSSPLVRLHTALATGADQLAATSARQQDFEVRAMLPFPPEEYGRDFTSIAEHKDFRDHLDAADGYFALPGTRESEEDAYVLVGKAIVAASDILVAVWDGEGARGAGGTAHVVDLALRAGIPVIHISLENGGARLGPTRLLVGGDAVEPQVANLGDAESYHRLVAQVLLPVEIPGIQELEAYLEEDAGAFNLRIEYPLMLALLGIKGLSASFWRQTPLSQALSEHLQSNREKFETQALAYEWANFLAIRYAQLFRSGHVTNYVLAALAVLTALAGLIFPNIKPLLVFGELCILGLLFMNTRVGRNGAWHRKWLQYRHLAETLRSLSYLKETGLIGPPVRQESVSIVRGRKAVGDWTKWYAAAIWREMPSAEGLLDEVAVRALAGEVQRNHVEGQIAYHRINAERMHSLDHRLHIVGEVVMCIVIGACGLYLALSGFAHDLLKKLTPIFVFVTAGFPALGAAVFGLRGHGEHLLASRRSASTARDLSENSAVLEKVEHIEDLARELERTAEIMLSDLNEWTVAYSERALQVPG